MKTTKITLTQRYGMEGIGDTEHEYLTETEIEKSYSERATYIQDCKLKSIYGKEYTQTIEIENDPLLDISSPKESTESYSMKIINFNKKV